MKVNAWVDVGCPFCWLGKHHLEEALRKEGVTGDIEFMAFELDPTRTTTTDLRRYLTAKYGDARRLDDAHAHLASAGAAFGLDFDFKNAVVANTFDVHRVHAYAKTLGKGPAVMERFMRARQAEGVDLSLPDEIVRIAVDAGLGEAEVRRIVADKTAFAQQVRAEEEIAQELGVRGVPFIVLDGRMAITGAQPVGAMVQAIRQAQAMPGPSPTPAG
jgi:predicted DsbA family dithiol-disulfide isomerase